MRNRSHTIIVACGKCPRILLQRLTIQRATHLAFQISLLVFLIVGDVCVAKDAVDSKVPAVRMLSGEVTYTLEDGEQYHAENPGTFEIPSLEQRRNLKNGDIVKLMFRISNGKDSLVERMWVIVRSSSRDGYVGSLDNDPGCTKKIRAGMKVSFQPRHVINIWIDDAHPELKKPTGQPTQPKNG